MVLPLLISILICPGLLGTQESIRQSQQKEKREEHRARRCNLIATCVKSSLRSREINGRPIVLRGGKLYIDTGTSSGEPFGHQYAGYYLPYPDTKYEGLVTTITNVAPIMNWVYVDKETYEVKYGVRSDAQPNLTGPFDCTRQDRRLTFDGFEGFCAVEEHPTIWALYFDRDDDGLRSKIPISTRVLEIELTRREKRWKKEPTARHADQTTERAVNAQVPAPVETPKAPQPSPCPVSTKPATKVKGESDQAGITKAVENSKQYTEARTTAQVVLPAVNSAPEPIASPRVSGTQNSAYQMSELSRTPTDSDGPPAYSEHPEDSTGLPIDPQSGSEWSIQGDDQVASRSLAGFTPASSVHGDDMIVNEQPGVDKPGIPGLEPDGPTSPHDRVPRSLPLSMPAISEEYCCRSVTERACLCGYSMSSNTIESSHPLSHRYANRPATASGTASAFPSMQIQSGRHSFNTPQSDPSSDSVNPLSPIDSAPQSQL
ncbi:hypothetical protein K432DRAFT_428185 [Lepidopterella palustris CBS 459.81]|uniref:Uncharacterized protein n=1 Tax=Lepidopterella palustris CBS 459.81 TaxID=1314670 RepID=A0A8E2E4T0_9PEZI|nr:hypothetical protein K432DRAFT_428185 [Lepidopterella palustris CBS 459.81]